MSEKDTPSIPEKPVHVLIFGKDYPVELMVFTKTVPDIETQKVNLHTRLSLVNYGECDIFYSFDWPAIDSPDNPQPITPFSESV